MLTGTSSIQKILAELPTGLPSMLGNSDASRLIRMAYVQHIISKYLCHRIFQPFLFSLGKRYDKADTFFQSMSNQLREKSTRKEAVWRHYTLLAGYTASNAKKNAGVAAASVIEEIAGYVKPFADQKNMDVITSGITRIVKFAVETWRYARMEREMITASMTTDDTERSSWECHSYERQSPYFENALFVSQLNAVAAGRVMILPLLPVFSREGTLPTLHRPLAVLDSGLIFSRGTALYTNCLPVLHRKYELNLLQLPPSITTKERVAQLDADRVIEEVKEEVVAAEAAVAEAIPVIEEELLQEQEPWVMEDEAEKAIEEALRDAAAVAKATDLEALSEVEETIHETILETAEVEEAIIETIPETAEVEEAIHETILETAEVEAELEQSSEVDAINQVAELEPAMEEAVVEVEVAHIPEEITVEAVAEGPEEAKGDYKLLERCEPQLTLSDAELEVEAENEVVAIAEVMELLVADEAAPAEVQVEDEAKIDNVMVDVEEMTEEFAAEESVVGGVEIEQEPEVVEQVAELIEETPVESSPVMDFTQTAEPIVEAPENAEGAAELQVDQPLPELESIQEVALESKPLIIAVEEADNEVIAPKEEPKEPKSPKMSRKTKKVGTKKSKKSAL